MGISELTSLVEPPETPSEVPKRPAWKAVEKKVGTSLPDDYKEFVVTYGSGLLGNFIIAANPFSTVPGVELFSVIEILCSAFGERKEIEGDEGVPFDIYPHSPGLLPWGGDENGNGLFWLTAGKPNKWPSIAFAGRDRRWQRFDMPMTTFLAKTLSGDVKCKIWPGGFARPKRRRVFEPY